MGNPSMDMSEQRDGSCRLWKPGAESGNMSLQLPHATATHSNSYHGRRLMQMLFRANASSNNEEHAEREPRVEKREPLDPRAEEDSDRQQQQQAASSFVSLLNAITTWREPPLLMPTAQPSSKFHSLKRKLFPNRMRTALPARIPALVTSPISVSVSALSDASEVDLDSAGSNNQDTRAEPESFAAVSSHARATELRHRASVTIAAVKSGDKDNDLELEMAIENLDSSTEQDTLNEMNRAIEDLALWKHHQEQETQAALRKIDQPLGENVDPISSMDEDSQAFELEYTRKKQQSELDREAQMTHLKHSEERFQEMIPKTLLDGDDVARVEQVLLESNRLESAAISSSTGGPGSSSNSQTCRLRGDIFDLGVRELSSLIQASLLLELEGAESEFDMRLYDVDALTADLDSVLAQFSDPEAIANTSSNNLERATQQEEDDED